MAVNWFDQVLSMRMLVSSEKAPRRARRCDLRADDLGHPDGARQRLLDQVADAAGAAQFVGLVVELAVDEDGIERAAVGGGEDLGVDDVAAGGGAGAGDDRQQPGMVGGEDGDLGDALEGMGGGGGGERAPGLVGIADERGVGELVGQIDAQPVGRIVALEVGGALARRPVGERLGEFGLGRGNALVAADLAVAAGDHGLGLVVERAQELALPAVPDAGSDRLDVGDGEHQQHLQALHRLHDGGEIEDGLAVVEVARLGGDRHGEMLLDQPGDGLGLRLVEAEARAKTAGDAGAGDGMILRPALGDVVEQHGDVEDGAVLDAGHDLVGERMGLGEVAALDLGEHADRLDEVLVHRVVVVHVELHHRDDLAEIRNEPAEHAGLVHAAEHGFRIAPRGEDLDEEAVGLLVLAQACVDQAERARDLLHGVGMEGEVVAVGKMEEPDEVDRIAREDLLVGGIDAVVVDDEIGRARNRAAAAGGQAEKAIEHRRGLAVVLLQRGAEDARQVADILGDEEIVLHEALDVAQAGMGGVAEAAGHLALDVEGQALLGAAGEEMQVTAHRPEEILGLAEEPQLAA